MKTFIIVNSSWNVDMLRRDFINELKLRGHDVFVSHDSAQVDLKSLGCPDLERTILMSKIVRFLYLLILNIRSKESLVYSFTFYGNILTGFCVTLGLVRCRYYPTVTGLGKPYFNKMMRVPYFILMYVSLIRAKKVFFHNEVDLAIFTRFRIVSEKKAELVNGGGLKTFNVKSPQFVSPVVIFGTIARAIPEKGLHELVDCFAEEPLCNYQLLIVTDLHDRHDDYAFSLYKKISKLSNITLLNSNHDKLSFFSNINFFVLNSEREGRSRAIIEALSCGIPVVCRDVPGCNDIITDGSNGFSTQSIKSGLLNALQCSCEDWRSLSEKASVSFTPYAVESVVDDYLKVVE